MSSYYIVAGVAAVVALVATPIVRAIVMKLGGYDIPVDRKVHHAPTPTYGGVAIYLAFAAAIGAAVAFRSLRGAFRFSELLGLLVGGLIVMVIGMLDDHHDLSRPARLAGEFFAAGVVYLSGVQMSFFWLPGIGVISISSDVSAVLTIVWIVLLTNAVNYIDGLDGLATGLTAIASGALFLYSTRLPAQFLGPDPLTPLVAAALVGACIGFLPYNFNPARIFMGDTGAYPLGFFSAGATISMIGRFSGPGSAGGRLGLPLVFTPVVFLALPLGNFVLVTAHRLAKGQPIMVGERDQHIHYRLLELGHSHRRAVLVMYCWALVLAVGLVVAGTIPSGRFILAFAVAIGTIILLTLAPRLRASSEDEEEEEEDEEDEHSGSGPGAELD